MRLALLLANFLALLFVSNATLRPRGVSLSNAGLFHPLEDKSWLCLDGNKAISYFKINDDYCDCADGSDEPGTAACLNGRFHCLNDGYKEQDIPSSRVNDGVCDCCDGTDEYDSVKCQNSCKELGRADLLKHKNEVELHKLGAEKKIEMITRGKHLKTDRDARLVELRHRLNKQLELKLEKEQLKVNVETLESQALEAFRKQHGNITKSPNSEYDAEDLKKEASSCFVEIDTNNDGFIELTELMVDMTFDRDRNGVITVEEAKFFLNERDRIDLHNFITLAWPRIKPLKMLAEGVFKPPNKEVYDEASDVFNKIPTGNSNTEFLTNEGSEDAEPDHEELGEEDQYDDEEPDVGDGELSPEALPLPDYDLETKKFIEQASEVRNSFSELESYIREIEHEIKELEEQNMKDFGVNEEYALLHGECFKHEDREYIYTLCPFDRASQKQRSSSAETTLGRWEGWEGDNDNKYNKQKYSNGASCWNGPQRSTVVSIQCALESKITSVSEPNRCEYHFQFETPAACKNDPFTTLDANLHDEL